MLQLRALKRYLHDIDINFNNLLACIRYDIYNSIAQFK